MAGGKETPRQKMIGMMYLVLTALLALNVSKAVLDAFVAIEENIQLANIVQVDRGNGFYKDVTSELSSTKDDAENKAKREKLNYVIKQMDEINKVTGVMIDKIDKLKIQILEESGEAVKKVEAGSEETILWSEYTNKDTDKISLPTRMHLMAVQGMDKYDDPMRILFGTGEGGDLKNIKGQGAELWKDFNDYRAKIVELTGSYEWGGKTFTVKPTAINDYTDNKDLEKKVEKMIDASKGNLKEDRQVLIDLYIGMTKKEKNEVHGETGVHWIGKTFDHSPLVAAIASLSSMQQEILSARALALSHWKSKVSTGEYSFNKIMPLAYGPNVANTGDDVELQVMMAAFDSDNQPKVTIDGGGGEVTYPGNGQGIVKLKAGGSTMTVTGTVSIKNKSGVEKEEKWSKDIIIMKPSGSIELPELNVLYRGYPNKAKATASGYDQTVLTGQGATVSKSGDGYIVSPTGRGREAFLTVSGKSTATGKTVSLNKVKYRVSNLPDPELYWGAAKNGSKGSKAETKLFAKYPPEIPLSATFRIVSWECNVPGAARPVMGTGGNISAASGLIRAAKPGSQISFICKVVGPDGISRKKGGTFKI
jgi:gliding motility-associated protein GldM